MTQTIRTTEKTLRPIRDTGSPPRRIDPAQVQRALGAEEMPVTSGPRTWAWSFGKNRERIGDIQDFLPNQSQQPAGAATSACRR
jgi:hypothetical protein